MKLLKSLILGSTAGLVAMSGAQAADLPLKAKAVEYVRICSLYGAGFYYIPGTDTCIKLGGYLRVDVLANTNSDASGAITGAGGAQNRFTNGYTWRSREDLNLDTRTATEYGVVRTFFDALVDEAEHAVLVTAASRHGATREIAQIIGQALRERGLDSTVRAPEDVSDLAAYDAVVLGSAVYAGHWLPEALALARRGATASRGRSGATARRAGTNPTSRRSATCRATSSASSASPATSRRPSASTR